MTYKINNLKKKAFIIACYIVIIGFLLIYVSFSQYAISVKGEIIMPQVYTMNGTLALFTTTNAALSNAEAEVYADITGFIDDLGPGNKALSGVHSFDVIFNNYEEINGEKIVSQLGLQYELYIETEGLLPLEFIIKDDLGDVYIARTLRSLTHSSIQFKKNNIAFTHSIGGVTEASITHKIYVGWNNTCVSTTNTSIILSKEVEKITVKAKVKALEGQKATYTSAPIVDKDYVYKREE